jgi:hypothetical protein
MENHNALWVNIGKSTLNGPFSIAMLNYQRVMKLWKCCLASLETLHCKQFVTLAGASHLINRHSWSQRPSPKFLIRLFTTVPPSCSLLPQKLNKNATSSNISRKASSPPVSSLMAAVFPCFSSLNQPLLDPSLESPQWPKPLQSPPPPSPALELDAAQVAASAAARQKLGNLVHDTLLR